MNVPQVKINKVKIAAHLEIWGNNDAYCILKPESQSAFQKSTEVTRNNHIQDHNSIHEIGAGIGSCMIRISEPNYK